jgi:hypothetical protein
MLDSSVLLTVLAISGIVVLLSLLLSYTAELGTFSIVRAAIPVKEPFEVQDRQEEFGLSPKNAALENLRQPYTLLEGVLPSLEGNKPSGLDAEGCYKGDFQNRLQRTGNFRQLTNNYKRGTPDSCSAPLTELVTSFYQVEPLPPA